jgi:dinuclear metal center YbgI/SA1388 family protein
MKVKDIIQIFEDLAPSVYQESYDNSGLIVGHPEDEVTRVMLSLDTTEEVVDEAIREGCNLLIAHHPIVFKGLKKFNGKNYVERTVIKAIKNGIAIYAAHTNLDNVLNGGVNEKFAQKLGLKDLKILQSKEALLSKLSVYVPETHLEPVKKAIFEAGTGHIGNYSECSFAVQGTGSFKPELGSNPQTGKQGIREELPEYKVEVLLPKHLINRVLQSVRSVHPYEEVAYDHIEMLNNNQIVGAGVIGELEKEMEEAEFLEFLKKTFKTGVIRHTKWGKKIKKVAVCGGVGSFLIEAAKRSGADAYVTADVKYHEFFDAEGKLKICDIGHYESEISTLEIFYDKIKEKLPNFAVIFCQLTTNPIQYYT